MASEFSTYFRRLFQATRQGNSSSGDAVSRRGFFMHSNETPKTKSTVRSGRRGADDQQHAALSAGRSLLLPGRTEDSGVCSVTATILGMFEAGSRDITCAYDNVLH